jgi:hypothetical protein
MRKLLRGTFAFCLVSGGFVAVGDTSFAADTHVIVGTQDITWTYNGRVSARNKPLMVDDLKIGDIVEVQIPAGDIPHGFVTTKKDATGAIVVTKDPVLACGEDQNSKPNAALREINCGAASQFGIEYTGSMRLEVLATFKDEVDFYCVVHRAGMPGALKLKGAN